MDRHRRLRDHADGSDLVEESFSGDRVYRPSLEIIQAGEEVCSMRKLLFLAAFVQVMALVAVTGAPATGPATRSATQTSVVIATKTLPKLGTVLVNSNGRTLYMFVPDKRAKVTCVHACAAVWPPVKLPKGMKPIAKGKAKASLLGSDPDPAGGRVVTYNRWPLYTYVGDSSAGQAKGQALNLNGGLWYVLTPSGKVIRTKT